MVGYEAVEDGCRCEWSATLCWLFKLPLPPETQTILQLSDASPDIPTLLNSRNGGDHYCDGGNVHTQFNCS